MTDWWAAAVASFFLPHWLASFSFVVSFCLYFVPMFFSSSSLSLCCTVPPSLHLSVALWGIITWPWLVTLSVSPRMHMCTRLYIYRHSSTNKFSSLTCRTYFFTVRETFIVGVMCMLILSLKIQITKSNFSTNLPQKSTVHFRCFL